MRIDCLSEDFGSSVDVVGAVSLVVVGGSAAWNICTHAPSFGSCFHARRRMFEPRDADLNVVGTPEEQTESNGRPLGGDDLGEAVQEAAAATEPHEEDSYSHAATPALHDAGAALDEIGKMDANQKGFETMKERFGPTGRPSRRNQGGYIDLRDIDLVHDREDQGAPVALPLTVIGLRNGTEVSTLGGSDLGSVGFNSFTALATTEEEKVDHHDGDRYVLL